MYFFVGHLIVYPQRIFFVCFFPSSVWPKMLNGSKKGGFVAIRTFYWLTGAHIVTSRTSILEQYLGHTLHHFNFQGISLIMLGSFEPKEKKRQTTTWNLYPEVWVMAPLLIKSTYFKWLSSFVTLQDPLYLWILFTQGTIFIICFKLFTHIISVFFKI